MSERPKVPCPLCGGLVHPIAGRCRHCKGDLAGLRGRPDTPATTLPIPDALQPPRSAPVLAIHRPPVRASGPARWPLVVIGLSIAAIAIAIVAMTALPQTSPPSSEAPRTNDRSTSQPPEPPQPPALRALVKPPVAADLADYIGHLPAYGTLHANIDTTLGTIHCELFPDKAPIAVANFVGLATGKKPWLDAAGNVQRGKPFYDGLTFHRVVREFMIQGGDPLGTGTGGPGYKFANEIDPALAIEPGALAMANAGPGTNGSQFFISEITASWLDGKHTVFGHCDLAVVHRIARVATNSSDKPVEPVTMTVTITR